MYVITTIAYKDGIIAYESLLTSDLTITDDDYDKCRVVEGVRFYFSGHASDYRDFADSWISGKSEASVTAIVVQDDRVYASSTSDGKIWKLDITDMIYAIGSGSDHALTAMDLGCNSREAVKMAIKRDTCSGGRIRTFKVKK